MGGWETRWAWFTCGSVLRSGYKIAGTEGQWGAGVEMKWVHLRINTWVRMLGRFGCIGAFAPRTQQHARGLSVRCTFAHTQSHTKHECPKCICTQSHTKHGCPKCICTQSHTKHGCRKCICTQSHKTRVPQVHLHTVTQNTGAPSAFAHTVTQNTGAPSAFIHTVTQNMGAPSETVTKRGPCT